MEESLKQLLLKDLCERLPYGVKVQHQREDYLDEIQTIEHISRQYGEIETESVVGFVDDFKPYLRPMSSMTKEEIEILKSKCLHTETEEDWEGVRCDSWGIEILEKYDTRRWDNPIWPSTINMDAIDWLNTHHFDYRGLIEKGLAIEVTEENNPYKN